MRILGKARFNLYVTSMVIILFGEVCAQDLNEPSTTPSNFATTTQQSLIEHHLHAAILPTLRGTEIVAIPQQESPLSRQSRAKSPEQIHTHKHDPSQTETFLGQVTLNSPAELPPEFASRDIPGFRQSPEYLLRNAAQAIYEKDSSQIEISSTTQRTNTLELEGITKMSEKENFTPAYLNLKSTKYTIMPRNKLLDLEPLLEEPMNKKDYSQHNKQDVEVINSVTKASTDLSVDSGITKRHEIVATTNKKELYDLGSADDSYTTPFTTENVRTTGTIHEENTTQEETTLNEIQLTSPTSTAKTVHGTMTTEDHNIEKTTPTLHFTKSNFENQERSVSGVTATKSSLIDCRQSASTAANEDIAAVNNKTLSRYNQSSRSISKITESELASETEAAVHTTIVSLIGSNVNVSESSTTAATIGHMTPSKIETTDKTLPTTAITDEDNGGSGVRIAATTEGGKSYLRQHVNEYKTKPLSPGETITGNSNVSSMNNSDNSQFFFHRLPKEKPNVNKISLSLKDIFKNAINLDQGKVDNATENFTEPNFYQKDHPYSVPSLQTFYTTKNDSLTVSANLENLKNNQSKHLPINHNQTPEHSIKEISTQQITHYQRPLALVKSWSTKTNSDTGPLSSLGLPTPNYRIGMFPSKTEITSQISKVANFNVCSGECDLAGIIKLTDGVTWIPQLSDKNTEEWQMLANEVRIQLERIYNKSGLLRKWYKKIRVDGFSEGSVLVDYIVELNDIGRQINTFEIRKMFHESLDEVVRSLGGKKMVKFKTNLGNFTIDPIYTDFIVLPHLSPTIEYAEDNLLPQWAIAVIVIGLASLLFVIIFGVTVLTNRRKTSKKKLPLPFAEDIFAEVNKKHMLGIENYGADSIYNME